MAVARTTMMAGVRNMLSWDGEEWLCYPMEKGGGGLSYN
jgi:hypothetical protein